MKFTVHELPKAKWDKENIFRWLNDRSPTGAIAWLDAYDDAIEKMKSNAGNHSVAFENDDLEFEVRQAFFTTRRGRCYRIIYFVEQDDVYILRVRGQGQAPVTQDDLERS